MRTNIEITQEVAWKMDDLRSWWEVPSIAHFCSLFRSAFDLTDFDIEDLEEALLGSGNDVANDFLLDLVCKLLNGCYGRKDVTVENFDAYVKDIIKYRWDGSDNPIVEKTEFKQLTLREKVEFLHAICECRLDTEDVFDMLKGFEGDNMRVEPLGKDRNGATYWYFYGSRLYMEDAPVKRELTKEQRRAKEKERKKELMRKKREEKKQKKAEKLRRRTMKKAEKKQKLEEKLKEQEMKKNSRSSIRRSGRIKVKQELEWLDSSSSSSESSSEEETEESSSEEWEVEEEEEEEEEKKSPKKGSAKKTPGRKNSSAAPKNDTPATPRSARQSGRKPPAAKQSTSSTPVTKGTDSPDPSIRRSGRIRRKRGEPAPRPRPPSPSNSDDDSGHGSADSGDDAKSETSKYSTRSNDSKVSGAVKRPRGRPPKRSLLQTPNKGDNSAAHEEDDDEKLENGEGSNIEPMAEQMNDDSNMDMETETNDWRKKNKGPKKSAEVKTERSVETGESTDMKYEGETENEDSETENKDRETNNKDGETEIKDGETENKDGETENKDGETENKDGESQNKDGETESKDSVESETNKVVEDETASAAVTEDKVGDVGEETSKDDPGGNDTVTEGTVDDGSEETSKADPGGDDAESGSAAGTDEQTNSNSGGVKEENTEIGRKTKQMEVDDESKTEEKDHESDVKSEVKDETDKTDTETEGQMDTVTAEEGGAEVNGTTNAEPEKSPEPEKPAVAPTPSPSTTRWHLVCSVLGDWQNLARWFKNSPVRCERLLSKLIREDFLPMLPEIIESKENERKKRLQEFETRRKSDRITFKQKEKMEQEKILAEALMEEEKARIQAEEEKKLREEHLRLEEENKQREERLKAREERAKRLSMREERARLIAEGKEIPPELLYSVPQNTKDDSDSDDSRGDLKDDESYETLMKVIRALKLHKDCWPFLEPVTDEQAPGYSDVIKRPMDMSKIEEKVANKDYRHSQHFISDFKLMFNNCKRYNGQDSEFTGCARSMELMLKKYSRRFLTDQPAESNYYVDRDFTASIRAGLVGGKKTFRPKRAASSRALQTVQKALDSDEEEEPSSDEEDTQPRRKAPKMSTIKTPSHHTLLLQEMIELKRQREKKLAGLPRDNNRVVMRGPDRIQIPNPAGGVMIMKKEELPPTGVLRLAATREIKRKPPSCTPVDKTKKDPGLHVKLGSGQQSKTIRIVAANNAATGQPSVKETAESVKVSADGFLIIGGKNSGIKVSENTKIIIQPPGVGQAANTGGNTAAAGEPPPGKEIIIKKIPAPHAIQTVSQTQKVMPSISNVPSTALMRGTGIITTQSNARPQTAYERLVTQQQPVGSPANVEEQASLSPEMRKKQMDIAQRILMLSEHKRKLAQQQKQQQLLNQQQNGGTSSLNPAKVPRLDPAPNSSQVAGKLHQSIEDRLRDPSLDKQLGRVSQKVVSSVNIASDILDSYYSVMNAAQKSATTQAAAAIVNVLSTSSFRKQNLAPNAKMVPLTAHSVTDMAAKIGQVQIPLNKSASVHPVAGQSTPCRLSTNITTQVNSVPGQQPSVTSSTVRTPQPVVNSEQIISNPPNIVGIKPLSNQGVISVQNSVQYQNLPSIAGLGHGQHNQTIAVVQNPQNLPGIVQNHVDNIGVQSINQAPVIVSQQASVLAPVLASVQTPVLAPVMASIQTSVEAPVIASVQAPVMRPVIASVQNQQNVLVSVQDLLSSSSVQKILSATANIGRVDLAPKPQIPHVITKTISVRSPVASVSQPVMVSQPVVVSQVSPIEALLSGVQAPAPVTFTEGIAPTLTAVNSPVITASNVASHASSSPVKGNRLNLFDQFIPDTVGAESDGAPGGKAARKDKVMPSMTVNFGSPLKTTSVMEALRSKLHPVLKANKSEAPIETVNSSKGFNVQKSVGEAIVIPICSQQVIGDWCDDATNPVDQCRLPIPSPIFAPESSPVSAPVVACNSTACLSSNCGSLDMEHCPMSENCGGADLCENRNENYPMLELCGKNEAIMYQNKNNNYPTLEHCDKDEETLCQNRNTSYMNVGESLGTGIVEDDTEDDTEADINDYNSNACMYPSVCDENCIMTSKIKTGESEPARLENETFPGPTEQRCENSKEGIDVTKRDEKIDDQNEHVEDHDGDDGFEEFLRNNYERNANEIEHANVGHGDIDNSRVGGVSEFHENNPVGRSTTNIGRGIQGFRDSVNDADDETKRAAEAIECMMESNDRSNEESGGHCGENVNHAAVMSSGHLCFSNRDPQPNLIDVSSIRKQLFESLENEEKHESNEMEERHECHEIQEAPDGGIRHRKSDNEYMLLKTYVFNKAEERWIEYDRDGSISVEPDNGENDAENRQLVDGEFLETPFGYPANDNCNSLLEEFKSFRQVRPIYHLKSPHSRVHRYSSSLGEARLCQPQSVASSPIGLADRRVPFQQLNKPVCELATAPPSNVMHDQVLVRQKDYDRSCLSSQGTPCVGPQANQCLDQWQPDGCSPVEIFNDASGLPYEQVSSLLNAPLSVSQIEEHGRLIMSKYTPEERSNVCAGSLRRLSRYNCVSSDMETKIVDKIDEDGTRRQEVFSKKPGIVKRRTLLRKPRRLTETWPRSVQMRLKEELSNSSPGYRISAIKRKQISCPLFQPRIENAERRKMVLEQKLRNMSGRRCKTRTVETRRVTAVCRVPRPIGHHIPTVQGSQVFHVPKKPKSRNDGSTNESSVSSECVNSELDMDDNYSSLLNDSCMNLFDCLSPVHSNSTVEQGLHGSDEPVDVYSPALYSPACSVDVDPASLMCSGDDCLPPDFLSNLFPFNLGYISDDGDGVDTDVDPDLQKIENDIFELQDTYLADRVEPVFSQPIGINQQASLQVTPTVLQVTPTVLQATPTVLQATSTVPLTGITMSANTMIGTCDNQSDAVQPPFSNLNTSNDVLVASIDQINTAAISETVPGPIHSLLTSSNFNAFSSPNSENCVQTMIGSQPCQATGSQMPVVVPQMPVVDSQITVIDSQMPIVDSQMPVIPMAVCGDIGTSVEESYSGNLPIVDSAVVSTSTDQSSMNYVEQLPSVIQPIENDANYTEADYTAKLSEQNQMISLPLTVDDNLLTNPNDLMCTANVEVGEVNQTGIIDQCEPMSMANVEAGVEQLSGIINQGEPFTGTVSLPTVGMGEPMVVGPEASMPAVIEGVVEASVPVVVEGLADVPMTQQ